MITLVAFFCLSRSETPLVTFVQSFPHCVLADVSSKSLPEQKQSDTGHICLWNKCNQCDIPIDFDMNKYEQISQYIHINVRFQVYFQSTFPNRCIVTLSNFWLFSTVRFQMWPQCTWFRAFIVTLLAFVWLFSTVCFHVSPKNAYKWDEWIVPILSCFLHTICHSYCAAA